ncbi:TonB-dependent receptor [Fulvivirga ligni]|uniref:TonB-dependent receptor n=1 Tax=Fulvivirga ligni TaxID=2904246 RepID=UPI001F2CEC29|nr:TonB-dependent receptor [Fulvivirga ligni]UII19045.1 TonB-dependent receptor plug domain-containing protein [Fulvivirga ligni]
MLRKLILSFFLINFSLISYAQKITGMVLDESNRAVEEAYILNERTGNHTHAEHFGQFFMVNTMKGDTLQVRHIGYEPASFVVNDLNQDYRITLKEKVISLDEIMVSPELDAINVLTDINIKTSPVNTSQELLRQVPGLVIGQHAGGGKAEQIFLRGFDIDHGTDISISVDGMPVNMVSHAHGQGYADLHFLIPETIDNINFGKGPYYADQGDFTTTGYVGFKTKDKLNNSLIKLEAGQYNTQRFLGMFQVVDKDDQSAYLAADYNLTDGPFDSPQNFSRLNLMAKYSGKVSDMDKISLSASHFTSSWDASGQVPQRAIDNGTISRFGAIDDTEGGKTSRTNLIFNYIKGIDENTFVKSTAFYANYEFELFSNFTFFLNDPENGDQIHQKEQRDLFGLKSELNKSLKIGFNDALFQFGAGFRNDQSHDNELSHTLNRTVTLDTLALGDIDQTNMFSYVNLSYNVGKWVINPSVRFDYFKFNYYDKTLPIYQTQAENEGIVSPKLNVLYNPSRELQLYLKTGKGFHSNDTRVVVAQNGKEILPAAWGSDLGMIWKPTPKLFINAAYWYLFLEQEFVYVGDEAVVEPSGRTRRQGVDFSFRYQPVSWLYWNTDVNYTLARSADDPEGENYIPLAPDFTIMSGLSVIHPSGIYGGAHLRHIDHRPANEDNSIVAKGYTVVDLNLGYQWKNFDLGINIQNLFNVDWNETQFATESRLPNETEPVEEIHFTPGSPFWLKASIGYKF